MNDAMKPHPLITEYRYWGCFTWLVSWFCLFLFVLFFVWVFCDGCLFDCLFVSKPLPNPSYFMNCICMERTQILEEIFLFFENQHQTVPVKPKY